MLKPFLGQIRDRLPACCVNQRCQEIPLVSARYGEDAGIAGGAALCFDAAKNEARSEPAAERSEVPSKR